MKELIKNFIDLYGTPVSKDESVSQVELMMDNHKCIKWEGVEYYIPEENSFWGEDDELIYEFLSTCYHV